MRHVKIYENFNEIYLTKQEKKGSGGNFATQIQFW